MRTWTGTAGALAALLALGCSNGPASQAQAAAEGVQAPAPLREFSYRFAALGTVAVYRPAAPGGVVLFLSGDGGWNAGATRMARTLAQQGALVAGISTPAFTRALETGRACVNPNYGLINLSRDIQHRLKLPMYMKPIIVGYSAGATLAYASLAQGPNGSYKAVVSMGFSPDLPGRNPWCKSGSLKATPIAHPARGWLFAPSRKLPSPWIVLQGQQDRVVDFDTARAFAAQVPNARFIALPGVGHGFSDQAAWMPQLMAQLRPMLRPATAALSTPRGVAPLPTGLPLTVVADPTARRTDMMAVLYSGDGGWVGLDKDVAAQLARAGIPVVGMDSLSYFWSERTPAGAGADLNAVIRGYSTRWRRPKVLLVGYSFGADALPYIVGHLPRDTRAQVRRLSLLGLSPTADFQFHLSSWLDAGANEAYPTPPAIARLRGLSMQCFQGQQESDSACAALPNGLVSRIVVPGGHHFNRNAPLLARHILSGLPV